MPQFQNYPTIKDVITEGAGQKWDDHRTFYSGLFSKLMINDTNSHLRERAVCESLWYDGNKPYYNCYPKITPILSRMKLTIPMETMGERGRSFLVRLREDDTSLKVNDKYHIKTVLWSHAKVINGEYWVLCYTYGEYDEHNEEVVAYTMMPYVADASIDESVDALPEYPDISNALVKDCFRLICTICLLDKDEELLERDVLNKDFVKYHEGRDREKIEARALRYGRNGFTIGRRLECDPSWRNPHPCLFHIGPGRRGSIIKIRKGSLVHREKVVKVPSGHL